MAEQITENTTEILQGSVQTLGDSLFLFCDGGAYSGFYSSQEDGIKLQSDITDQYVEDNSAISDHIGIKPLTFTLRGRIGDVVYNVRSDNTLFDDIAKDNNRNSVYQASMSTIRNIMPPELSNYMSVAKATSTLIIENINKVVSIGSNIWDIGAGIKRGISILKDKDKNIATRLKDTTILKATGGFTGERTAPRLLDYATSSLIFAWEERTKFTVKNDFGTFDNCYITDIDIKQTDRYTAEITCSLKQIRFVETKTTKIDYDKYQEFCAQQRAMEEDLQKPRGTQALQDGRYFDATLDLLGK